MQINNDLSIGSMISSLHKPATGKVAQKPLNHRVPNPAAKLPPVSIEKPNPPQPKPLEKPGAILPALTTALSAKLDPAPVSDTADAVPTLTTNQQPPAPHTMSIDELVAQWGQTDSEYDLNSDGTVNVQDLMLFITNWNKYTQPGGTPPQSPETAEIPADNNQISAVSDSPSSTEELSIKDDSSLSTAEDAEVVASDTQTQTVSDPQIQPDADTSVNSAVSDASLREYLTGLTSSDAKPSATTLNGAAKRAANAALGGESVKGAAQSLGGLNRLTNALFDHLSANGFAEQPPVNIRELVDGLNFSSRQSDFVLKQLAAKYPAGLGIDETV